MSLDEAMNTPDITSWKYHFFWYLAYTYFQNKHFVNYSTARLKDALSSLENVIYKKKWHGSEIKNPIFIIAPHRSGTTILQQILCLHSQVATPRMYSDLFDMFPILAKRYFPASFLKPIARKMDDIMVGFDSPQEAQGLILRYFENRDIPYNHTAAADLRDYMRKILYIERKGRFLWKAPYLTRRIPEIAGLFPDARFIYLHRDPLVCVDSKMKFIAVWRGIAESPAPFYRLLVGRYNYSDHSPLGYFMEQANRTVNLESVSPDPRAMTGDHLVWIRRALGDLENLADPRSSCFLAYDDLIRRPAHSLAELFRFLDLPDEGREILAKLDDMGMPLRMPTSGLKYIPEGDVSAVKQMCDGAMRECLARINPVNWTIIGGLHDS
ncbi:MAG: sulfotransferase family protein [Deltaproteobacteria bacterium]